MKKHIPYIILLCFVANTATAQVSHMLPKFMRKIFFESDSSRGSSLIPLPVFSSSPETGLEFGGSVLYSFYADTLHRETRVSNIFAYGTVTTKGQNRFGLSTSHWFAQNKYHYSASGSYIDFPANFYGIGNATRSADAERVIEKRFKFFVGGEKLFAKNVYAGLLAGLLSYKYGSENFGVFETDPRVQFRDGGTNLLFGPSFVFDTRDNNTYTNKGVEVVSSYQFYKGIFGTNNYNGGLFTIEATQYNHLGKRLNLAFDFYDTNLIGGQSPFYLLPTMGSDELMRGYYNGRFRDRNYVAGQAELRYRFSPRFGFAFFGGAGNVFNNSFSFADLKPSYGGGLRYFFDVEKGLDISFDYALGEQRPGESRQSGFYIRLGEAF
jgi:hypothetical protein